MFKLSSRLTDSQTKKTRNKRSRYQSQAARDKFWFVGRWCQYARICWNRVPWDTTTGRYHGEVSKLHSVQNPQMALWCLLHQVCYDLRQGFTQIIGCAYVGFGWVGLCFRPGPGLVIVLDVFRTPMSKRSWKVISHVLLEVYFIYICTVLFLFPFN